MKFKIKLSLQQPENGNPRQVNAALTYNDSDLLKTHLGTFMYYHFLREFFEDVSRFQRIGDIAFCKPGLGDLCITWNVSTDIAIKDIKSAIINGLLFICTSEKQKYWEKYSIDTSLHYLNDDDYFLNNTFELAIETKFHSHHKVAVNADWAPEIQES